MAFSYLDPRPFDPDPCWQDEGFTSMLNGSALIRKPLILPQSMPVTGYVNAMYIPMQRNFRDYSWAVTGGSPRVNGAVEYRSADGSKIRIQPGAVMSGTRGGGMFMPPMLDADYSDAKVNLTLPAPSPINFANVFTISIKPDFIPVSIASPAPIITYSHSTGTGYFRLSLTPAGRINVRAVADDGTVITDTDSTTIVKAREKVYTIQVVSAFAHGVALYIDGIQEFDDTAVTSKLATIDTACFGGDGSFAGLIEEYMVYGGLSFTDLADVEEDMKMLRPAHYPRDRSGKPVVYGYWPFTLDCRETHIFGGGQRSLIEKLTENVDMTRYDRLVVVPFTRDIDVTDQLIVNTREMEMFGIQNAGGQNHHLQIFARYLGV